MNPKNILFVHFGDDWIRGSEQCLLDLAGNLNRSHNVQVWCNSNTLCQVLKNHCIISHYSDMNILLGYQAPRWNFCGYIKQIARAIQLINQHKIDLVHINSAAPAQWMAIACKLTHTPFLVQLHSDYPCLKDRVSLGLHFCKHIIGVSHAALNGIRKDNISNQIQSIIPNGIDCNRLNKLNKENLKKYLHIADNEYLILSVGSLIQRKGQQQLICALPLIQRVHAKTHVVFIGSGPMLFTLKDLAKKMDVTQNVHFLGNVHDAYRFMGEGTDLVVSTATEEVFGLTAVEANLAGTTVVAPNIPGITSVVKRNKTGYLYKSQCRHSLAKTVVKALSSDNTGIVARARVRVQKKFDINSNTTAFTQQYQNIFRTNRCSLLSLASVYQLTIRIVKKYFLSGAAGHEIR